jgi:hypothetical protein
MSCIVARLRSSGCFTPMMRDIACGASSSASPSPMLK